jgi:hypothetical protein
LQTNSTEYEISAFGSEYCTVRRRHCEKSEEICIFFTAEAQRQRVHAEFLVFDFLLLTFFRASREVNTGNTESTEFRKFQVECFNFFEEHRAIFDGLPR